MTRSPTLFSTTSSSVGDGKLLQCLSEQGQRDTRSVTMGHNDNLTLKLSPLVGCHGGSIERALYVTIFPGTTVSER